MAVSVNPNPQVAFNFTQNPVCTNVNPVITLSGSTPAGGSYTGTGVTGNTFDATSLNLGTYTLTYTYTDAHGCIGMDTANVVVTICTGIENTEAAQLTVYPNPFTDALVINTNGNYEKGVAVIMDATGRKISSTEFAAGAVNVQLNTSTLASGAYLLNIIVDGKSVANKKLFRME